MKDIEVFGVAEDATLADIERRWRELVKVHHPDKGGSSEEFIRLKEVYERLRIRKCVSCGGSGMLQLGSTWIKCSCGGR